MSDYGAYDEPRRYRSTRTRPRERDEPDFVEETTYIERGKGRPPQDLVPRPRDDDSVEDIPRDYIPSASGASSTRRSYRDDYGPPARRPRSESRYSDDDDYSDEGAAAGGAAAGYAASKSRDRRRSKRDSRRDRDYHSDDDSPPRKSKSDRRQSGLEKALEGLGLGGVATALTGGAEGRDRSRSKSRRRRDDDDSSSDGGRSRSRPRGEKKERQWAQAAQAALIAGAVEAFRARGGPGPWTGEKGRRVATAAISAGGVDKLIGKDPDHKSKRHLAEAVIGGLAANRLANGPRSRSRGGDDRGRSRSRSRSVVSGIRSRSRSVLDRFRSKSRGRSASRDSEGRERGKSAGGLKELVAGGTVAALGKEIYDRVRSKSRGAKDRRRDQDSGSEDDYAPSRSRKRSDRDRDVGEPQESSRGINDNNAVVERGRESVASGGESLEKRASSEDSESSTDIEQKRKKMKGKELVTAGLATVATIHAAHGVYQSMEASEKRHKLVAEGKLTAEEARKKRSKAWLQDAAAVGIAALGIKGAYSEWKEMNEQRHSVIELEERRRKRRKQKEKRARQMRENGGNYMSGGNGPAGSNSSYYDGSQMPPPPMGSGYSNGGGGGGGGGGYR